jgi:hypothetical protein
MSKSSMHVIILTRNDISELSFYKRGDADLPNYAELHKVQEVPYPSWCGVKYICPCLKQEGKGYYSPIYKMGLSRGYDVDRNCLRVWALEVLTFDLFNQRGSVEMEELGSLILHPSRLIEGLKDQLLLKFTYSCFQTDTSVWNFKMS